MKTSNIKYEEVTILSDNIPIVLSIWENEKHLPSVIFLPGTMAHPLLTADFLNDLSKSGFNVIGVHFLSHGKSPKIKKRFTFDDLFQNVYDTVTYVKDRFNDKIALMGSSQGGILASSYASKDERIKTVFAHNIMLSNLKETMSIITFPKFMRHFFNQIKGLIGFFAKIFPDFKVNISMYLNINKIFKDEKIRDSVMSDPLLLRSYPLCFISSLINLNTNSLTDGSTKCNLFVITSSGDPLFTLDYTKLVFDKIKTAKKELIIIDKATHMIFNDCKDEVIKLLIPLLKENLI